MVFKQRAQATDDKQIKRRADKDKSERRVERKDKKDEDAPRNKSGKSENRLIRYFQETSVELRKVAWPTREQTTRLTLIVLGAVFAFAIFFGAIDLLFEKIIAFLV